MKIPRTTFRFKITISLFLVIVSMSVFNFYFYDQTLKKMLLKDQGENLVSVFNVLKDQFYTSLYVDDKDKIFSLMHGISKNNKVINSYLINSEGKVIYPEKLNYLDMESLSLGDSSVMNRDFTLMDLDKGNDHFSRTFIRMENSSKCYQCHSANKESLGYLVIDFSMEGSNYALSFSHKYSFIITVIMVLLIIGLVIIMHYRFVKKSLSKFESSITIINRGNLDERIIIPKSKELGALARSFNTMMDNFQATQLELREYHKIELDSKEKMATIGEMAARMAHEVRNPLTGISNAIEVIIKKMNDDENKPIMEEIRRQAKRVNDAISNLLQFSHRSELKLEETDINERIRALCFFVKNQAHNKVIEFKSELQPGLPLVMLDSEQIENALLNLALNAIAAIEVEGRISCKTLFNSENNTILLCVEDTGQGISEETMKDIFNPFFTTKTEGTGLGLTIVKEIVEKHKGKMWVESEEGVGTRFYISLPVLGIRD